MKIMIIGSTSYQEKMEKLKLVLEAESHEVKIPAFDSNPSLDSLGVCVNNLNIMKWCDCIYMIWDGRSNGTIFDMGMAFALNKPVRIHYINDKTFQKVFESYADVRKCWFEEHGLV